ncbi:hypothetical protein [Pseudomonas aegrilactucae]|uniref:Lipoprotein n=1 Tax=Pseudomonas aegrilactucae TaxID=2854028 RepID=A0A9Q3ABU1_9PSED|nr:hypothetical protein [Pseudomonas aegrilactucae]MBV6286365.1 hypothetical protein [Pseudomonas aegrilactucae]
MRRVLLCALALLLAGCEKEFLVLHFQAPVGDLYASQDVHYSFRDSIREVLHARNIPTDSLVMEMDAHNDKVVHLRLADDSLSPRQLDEIREVFESILPARNAVTLKLRMSFDTERLQGLDINRRATGQPPRDFDKAVLSPLDLSIVLGRDYSTPPFRNTFLHVQPGSGDDMLCTLETVIAPALPFNLIGFTPATAGTAEHGLLRVVSRNFQAAQVPVHLSFIDAALRRQIDDASLRVTLGAKDWTDFKSPDKDRLYFVLGAPLESTGSPRADAARMYSECHRRLRALGRPFSFFLGAGVDRLTYVGLPATD